MNSLRPIAVVVPCYNEEQRLNPFAFHRFLADSPRCRLVFVNDGSKDGTLTMLQDFAAACSPGLVDVVDLVQNGGKAEAVRHGMLHAIRQEAELIGFWDADLATPLDAVDSFVRVFSQAPEIEIVVGTRLPLLGHQVQRNPKRGLLGRCFAWAASFTLGIRLQDTQCGAKMFRNSRVLVAVLKDRFQSRWIFDVELLARWRQLQSHGAAGLNSCLYEMPLHAWFEVKGSKLKLTDFLKAPLELWNIWRTCRNAVSLQVIQQLQPLSVEADTDRQAA
jgi:dolichyl-phosphate beta-glucosyltransferase